jgi:sulfatase modifying factor 1
MLYSAAKPRPGMSVVLSSSTVAPEVVPIPGAAFGLGATPVTRAQYAPFVEQGRAPNPPWWDDPRFNALDQPVVGITWHEAAAYASWLGPGFRLPREDEWERAMRGGLAGAPTAWGPALPSGEIPAGPLAGPWPVGRGTPNGYGLYDPGTVVHEWCLDDVAPEARGGPPRKASRGGSWRHHVRWSAPSARSSLLPHLRYADYGFRVLRELP